MEKNKIKITLDYEEYSTLIENFQRLIAKEWESEPPDKEWISTLQFYISDFELNAGEPNSDVSVNSSLNYSTHSPRILKGVISMFQGSSLFQSSAV